MTPGLCERGAPVRVIDSRGRFRLTEVTDYTSPSHGQSNVGSAEPDAGCLTESLVPEPLALSPARRRLTAAGHASSCYFRTSVKPPNRKALVQITERCNLHCAHCFVSATCAGADLGLREIETRVIPGLLDARVESVTLTGGEPFVHEHVIEIVRALRSANLSVGICSNATLITDEHIADLVAIGGIHLNVSLDGFRADSHGRFRGNRESFETTVNTITALGNAGLLQGILSTPNELAHPGEYVEICDFASRSGATYLLLNPLSPFGRGIASGPTLQADIEFLETIREGTAIFQNLLDVTHVRFPPDGRPLSSCEAGSIIYVFTHGDVTLCPYLVFAARNPRSRYAPSEFVVGNILHDDVAAALDHVSFHERRTSEKCQTCLACDLNATCGGGCPAAVIAAGQRLGDVDTAVCPRTAAKEGGLR